MARISGQQPFTAVPNWIFQKQKSEPGWLSCNELSVLLVLQYFANGANAGSDVFPSQKTISACAGISKSSVIRAVSVLVEKKLVEKIPRYDESGQKSNIYRLMIWDGPLEVEEPPTPLSERHPPLSERHPPLVAVTPPPCQGDTRTRTNEQEPVNKKRRAAAPRSTRASRQAESQGAIELPEWLEPCRKDICKWLENRKQKHKLKPELSRLTINALLYAKEKGVLEAYCEQASEKYWQSLGFVGYKELVDKLAIQAGKASRSDQYRKMEIAPILYTLN